MADVKLICFYLPQFHPTPENDAWWGKGFTEWRNVTKAKPLFPGHYQPHIPADLGFYDLRLPEAREAQAEVAREYSIHGFCYYHYWFNGRRILERPFNEVLASGRPDFPFCLCWANENWTRVWDGGEKNVLLNQKYTHEDDLAHIESLMPAFRDERYIRIDGKPLFLVYRTELMPDPARTAELWREAAKRAGVGDLYLARVESFDNATDPRGIGFDAAVEFAPDGNYYGEKKFHGKFYAWLARRGLLSKGYIENNVVNYRGLAALHRQRPDPTFTRLHCVTPSWDNSPRRKQDAWIYHGSTPEIYGDWLKTALQRTLKKHKGDERVVFINAWNEWAEGNHLEPDLKWGRAYLEATDTAIKAAISGEGEDSHSPIPKGIGSPSTPVAKRLYWKTAAFASKQVELAKALFKK